MSTSAPPQVSVTESRRQPPAAWFWLGLSIATAWILALAVLTWGTANPVTVNRRQVLDSDLFVIARVVPSAAAQGPRLMVEPVDGEAWPWEAREPIAISNLPETPARPGLIYLFPLTQHSSDGVEKDDRVTPTRLPEAPPLIYPATPEAREQLDSILKSAGRPPAFPAPRPPAARD